MLDFFLFFFFSFIYFLFYLYFLLLLLFVFVFSFFSCFLFVLLKNAELREFLTDVNSLRREVERQIN